MSKFDFYTNTQYVQGLRRFLKLPKTNFLRTEGLTDIPATGRKGRLPRYCNAAVQTLEESVNAKARRAEISSSTGVGERYVIARDYLGTSNSEVARMLGVSRELTRLWSAGIHRPSDIVALANVLDVPAAWLEFGGEEHLPADSHIGVRVGIEALHYREQLYGMTTAVMADIPSGAGESHVQEFIEQSVRISPVMAQLARRAGGRWQLAGGTLLFAPWVPIQEHGLTRRYWSDEVEAMIEQELSSKSSVYGAWHALKVRCEEKGLKYPQLVSLHKRVGKVRERSEKFGIRFR